MLHRWFIPAPSFGLRIDTLLLDHAEGAYSVEVSSLKAGQIKLLDDQKLVRADGTVRPSPVIVARRAAKALEMSLEKNWESRPRIASAVAFPLISRSEWCAMVDEGAISIAPTHCILRDDLADMETLRTRLGSIDKGGAADIKLGVLPRLHEELFPGTTPIVIEEQKDDYPVVLALLDDVIRLLEGVGAVYGSPGVDALRWWRQELPRSRDRIRVSIVGEFKAGKSSLINAILKREACYVDEFEATTIGASYSDGGIESVNIEFEDGHTEDCSLELFKDRCALKQTAEMRSVAVTLRTGLPFDLVDTPGLGSFTDGHDEAAEAEIRRADLLIWAIDSNDAGSARESAFIKRAQEIGLPIIVALTKSDLLGEGDAESLIEYVLSETGLDQENVLVVSALNYLGGQDDGVSKLILMLNSAAETRADVQQDAYRAKCREAVDGARSILRFLIERNAPSARFLNAERAYLESSAAGISKAAKAEWLRVLREECAMVANSEEIQSAASAEEVEEALRRALPEAVDRATRSFLGCLRRLVRDEWRGALEQRSLEFEKRLAELLRSRPEATADLEFLQAERDAFRLRAEVVGFESEATAGDSRLWVIGIGAAAALLTVSLIPLAVAGVVAVLGTTDRKQSSTRVQTVDLVIGSKILDALLTSFQGVANSVEIAIDRIVGEVSTRSLIRLVDARGGPNYQSILTIENRANDLMDESIAIETG